MMLMSQQQEQPNLMSYIDGLKKVTKNKTRVSQPNKNQTQYMPVSRDGELIRSQSRQSAIRNSNNQSNAMVYLNS